MRIYEGSPRQDFEEVLRSVGSYLDDRGMREVLVAETDVGFIIQGLVIQSSASSWGDAMGHAFKETLTLLDDDIAKFMDDAIARRGNDTGTPDHYESALRVIGRYLDEHRPRDIFFFEQEGAYVLRLLQADQTGFHHALVEFMKDDITEMTTRAPTLRKPAQTSSSAKSTAKSK
jgi:hypothetical protein